jgi:hypothetical protein
MHHFYPRGAFYLACMAAGVVLMLLFYFWSEQIWALWVWLWTSDYLEDSYARPEGEGGNSAKGIFRARLT